jgi:hypothetical protein
MKPALGLLFGAALLWPTAASALQLRPEVGVGGWFLGGKGIVTGTDIAVLKFDHQKVEPEFHGGLGIGDRHHLEVSYLRIRRQEAGLVSGQILGVVRFQDQTSLDISLDYLRFRYGYSVIAGDWLDLQPFIALGYLREESTTVEQTFSQTSHQSDSAVFPLPGLQIVVAPAFPVRFKGRAEGIGTGSEHLIDVEGGAELAMGFAFAGVGYRHVDCLFQDGNDQDIANVRLNGVYLEGGVRF